VSSTVRRRESGSFSRLAGVCAPAAEEQSKKNGMQREVAVTRGKIRRIPLAVKVSGQPTD